MNGQFFRYTIPPGQGMSGTISHYACPGCGEEEEWNDTEFQYLALVESDRKHGVFVCQKCHTVIQFILNEDERTFASCVNLVQKTEEPKLDTKKIEVFHKQLGDSLSITVDDIETFKNKLKDIINNIDTFDF